MRPSQRGILLIGGLNSNNSGLSSVELIGLDNCSVPDLPEWRYNHGSFITYWGSLAVCGGWLDSKPWSSDNCLVFNATSKQWEQGLLGDVLGATVLGVISMDIGTYLIHPLTSSFLPSGKREWIAGPSPLEEVQCATGISATSFLAFGGKSVCQYDSSIAGPSSKDSWVADGTWPDLQVERYRPGCATLDTLSIVAGGRNELGEVLN